MRRKTQTETETDVLPVIVGETRFKTSLSVIIGVGATVVSAAVWGTLVYIDVQTLKENDKNKTAKIDEMSHQLSGVESDIKRIRWILDPTVSSHPILIKSGNP